MPYSNIWRNIFIIALVNLSLLVSSYSITEFFTVTEPYPQRFHTTAVYNNTLANYQPIEDFNIDEDIPKYEFCQLVKENSLTDPDSILELVDKSNQLPLNYIPTDLRMVNPDVYPVQRTILLRETAYTNIIPMLDEMNAQGFSYLITSGFRSYNTQHYAYNYWASYVGFNRAGLYAAAPGYSEHQLGTTVDIMSGENNYKATAYMGETKVGKWLEENAYKYGFVQSYPENKTHITGYNYEPWHYRYVGKYTANKLREENLTLAEYLYDFYNICL